MVLFIAKGGDPNFWVPVIFFMFRAPRRSHSCKPPAFAYGSSGGAIMRRRPGCPLKFASGRGGLLWAGCGVSSILRSLLAGSKPCRAGIASSIKY